MKKLLLRLGALALLIVLLPLPAVLQPSEPRKEASSAPDTASYAASAPFLQQELPAYYRVLETGSGRILKVSPKEYLKGTAAAELPAGWHRETVIAQMVASHSYALTVMAQMLPETPQISDDPTRHQGYLTEEERRTLSIEDAQWQIWYFRL